MRLIDADALKKLVKEFRDDAPRSTVRAYVCNVMLAVLGDEQQTPTIDAAPVRHGKWQKAKYIEAPVYVCSECGNREPLPRKFCPECGLMMEKEEQHAENTFLDQQTNDER